MRDQKARAAGRPRDAALERERANIRARRQGFASAADRQKRARQRAADLSVSRAEGLSKWGITHGQFERMRAANRKYSREYVGKATAVNTYDISVDRDRANFSDKRVGYIVSFFRANVDKKTNYWSLYDRKTNRRKERFGFPVTNHWQYLYLVEYGGFLSANAFESRYGINLIGA